MPKVSVVIPVYGVEKFIERCCRSLFEQTLDDIEFIFVDDCTPDKSIDILKSILDEYPHRQKQVKIFHNPQNLGATLTRKKGIESTTGEYVIHCDSDDWVDVTAYDKLYNFAKKNDLDIVDCEFIKIDDAGKKQHIVEPKDNDIIKLLLTGRKMGALWNRLVRGDIVRSNEIMYSAMGVDEDLILVLQYYYYAKKTDNLSHPLYYYYQNSNSVSSYGNAEKLLGQARQMAVNFETVLEFFKNKGLLRQYKEEIVARKFFDKRWILPAIQSAKDCTYWMELHPDINRSLYFCPYLSLQDKITSLLIEMRLYPALRNIIRLNKFSYIG